MYGKSMYTSLEFTDDSEASYDSDSDHGRAVAEARRQRATAPNPSRQAANQRERRRMRSINEAFDFLRKHIPQPHCQKKLSKVDTLRFAIDYIRQLDEAIREDTEAKAHLDAGVSGSKVFIRCHGSGGYAADGFSPVSGLALSWRNEKQLRLQQASVRTCVAKIWTPADPVKDSGGGDRFEPGDGLLDRIFVHDQTEKLLPLDRFSSCP